MIAVLNAFTHQKGIMGNTRSTSRLVRWFALVTYYAIFKHLPEYCYPTGHFARRMRQFCTRHLFTESGSWTNVERGVHFGSGVGISLGDQSSIGRDSRIQAIVIEDAVMIGPELLVLSRNHIFTDADTPIGWQGVTDVDPPHIGYGSWLGARVILLPGVNIGRYCVVGAGSVVTRDIPDYSVAAGNPARVIRRWTDPTD